MASRIGYYIMFGTAERVSPAGQLHSAYCHHYEDLCQTWKKRAFLGFDKPEAWVADFTTESQEWNKRTPLHFTPKKGQ